MKFRSFTLSILVLFGISVDNSVSAQEKLVWTEVGNGVWKVSVGKPENYNLLSASGVKPEIAALQKMQKTELVSAKAGIFANIQDGKTYLRFPLQRRTDLWIWS
ncbi:hypothetical protein ACFFJX_22320 [Pseudarcicella hirudinis]|uniref:hypothetical protein n=1 Tax=Pseudarcicella hirudinis TaxID=1079859 RepID=UPI0035E48A94